MKISIILNESYPYGMACTKRIHLYAKGLSRYNKVNIIIPKATERFVNPLNKKPFGKFEGVSFQYAGGSTIRSKFFLIRRIQDFYSFLCLLKIILNQKPNIIIITSNSYILPFIAKIGSIINKSMLISERSEIFNYKKNKITRLGKCAIRIKYQLFDGVITISDNLEKYFRDELKFVGSIITIPILIDPDLSMKSEHISNNIVYTGSLNDRKDGIKTIIKSFINISNKYPEINLILTGNLDNSPDKDDIIKLIKGHDRIILTGYINANELSTIVNEAKLLVLAKPKNFQNHYNSATKIGEYLISGRPILMTKNDTAAFFLKNREYAFLSEDDIESFTKELDFILSNNEFSNEIGCNGQFLANKLFNYKIQMEILNQFLTKVMNSKYRNENL